MNKKHTIEFIRAEFKKEGYTLVSTEYINNKQNLDYVCPKGHERSIKWNCWVRGHRCRQCWKESIKSKGNPMYDTHRYGENAPGFGKTRSEETKKKISETKKGNYLGKNNSNWNQNLTDEDRQDRRLIPGYKEWRIAVFEKANYTCEICGKRGGKLAAHHKNSYDNNSDQRTLLENGACVCKTCHKNLHHQYGRGNNTEKQFLEFKEKCNDW